MNRIPGRIVVELDDVASALLRDYMREGDECIEPGHDPRDVVSAAVVFMLEDPDDSDWDTSRDAVDRAKERRLGLEGKGQR